MLKKLSIMLLAAFLLFSPARVSANDDEYEIEGIVTAFDGRTISLVTKRGENVTVPINNQTRIDKKSKGEIGAGMKIEVEYKKSGEIKKIELEGNEYKKINTSNTQYQIETYSWQVWNPENSYVENKYSAIQEAKQIFIESNLRQKEIHVIPFDGQILVPLEEITEFLDAQLTYYDTIGVAEVKKGDTEFLFKLNKVVAFENMKKVVIPSPLQIQENELYLPINVIANGLGYQLSWDEEKSTITIHTEGI